MQALERNSETHGNASLMRALGREIRKRRFAGPGGKIRKRRFDAGLGKFGNPGLMRALGGHSEIQV